MKIQSTNYKLSFNLDDIRIALSDYVDFYYHRPDISDNMMKKRFKVLQDNERGIFSITVDVSSPSE